MSRSISGLRELPVFITTAITACQREPGYMGDLAAGLTLHSIRLAIQVTRGSRVSTGNTQKGK